MRTWLIDLNEQCAILIHVNNQAIVLKCICSDLFFSPHQLLFKTDTGNDSL